MIREGRGILDGDPIPVWVDRVFYLMGGSVAIGCGHDDHDRPVTFVGSSPRQLWAIEQAIEKRQEPVLTFVSERAIVG